jgi:cytochrome oxidase Cu insertion factor (SCO1/SenC/PrrC family)
MRRHTGKLRHQILIGVVGISLLFGASFAAALEVGDKAPDFELPSTTGEKISLSQFKGKKHVLIQFYTLEFNPT